MKREKFGYDQEQCYEYYRTCKYQSGDRVARKTDPTRHGTIQCRMANCYTGKPSHAGITWDDGDMEQVALKWLKHTGEARRVLPEV